MIQDGHLRLNRFRLKNFRCFGECEIELHPDLTVLVAENGQGKTAILDAIGIALGFFTDTIAGAVQSHKFYLYDVRLVPGSAGTMDPVLPTQFDAHGYVSGQELHWSRALRSYGHSRNSTKEAESLRQAANALNAEINADLALGTQSSLILPLVAFYGTGRLWSEHRLTEGKKSFVTRPHERLSGYIDCLSSSSSFKGMVAWYENKWNEVRDPRFSTELTKNVALIRAVQEAINIVMTPTGWRELDWDPERRGLVVEHASYGRLPLSALSDGVRNMVALVGDVARRCASLNPSLSEDAARKTPGVLLIDEVDMHLHPRWQQFVVDLLRKAFPCLQIILSTHSPHVLSTVSKESIRIIRLRDGAGLIETPIMQTRGIQSADVLSSIMRVDPVPELEEARWLTEYKALIEDGKIETDDAQLLRSKLVAHFGETHPVILDCERLLRFQKFRVKRVHSEGE